MTIPVGSEVGAKNVQLQRLEVALSCIFSRIFPATSGDQLCKGAMLFAFEDQVVLNIVSWDSWLESQVDASAKGCLIIRTHENHDFRGQMLNKRKAFHPKQMYLIG